MPFDRGTFSFTMFELNGEMPENAAEVFASRRGCKLDEVSKEPSLGWVTGHHLLDTEIDEGTAFFGGRYYLSLRNAVRKIPGSLLTALCLRAEEARMKATGKAFIGAKERKEIKEDTIERNIMKMPPSLSGIPVVIEPKDRLLFLGATSQTQIDLFIENFYQAFKMEPQQLTPSAMLAQMFNTTPSTFPPLRVADNAPDGDDQIGRDFLLYLWYLAENGKVVHTEDYGDFELMLEAPLVMIGTGEDSGSGEATIKKGDSPLRGAEVKAALSVGKKLKKAKLTFTRANEIWSGTFDADTFAFSGFSLPEGEAQDKSEIFAERIDALEIFREAWIAAFRQFAEAMLNGKDAETCAELRRWIETRDAI